MQFTLGSLLLAMLACSVTFAAAYYLLRSGPGGESMHLAGLVLLVSAPLLLVVAVSMAAALWRWFRPRG